MAEIVNLRMARKAKARSEAEKQAHANRTLHGQTKATKLAAKVEKQRVERHLEGVKRDSSIEP